MHQAGLVACQPRKAGPHHHPRPRSGLPPRSGEKEFHRQQTRAETRWARSAFPHLGRIHLSSNRHGLRPEMKIIGYGDRRGVCAPGLLPRPLRMAVRNCPVTRGETIFPSGAWFTLASQLNCAEVMDAYGIRASVGRTGSCYDNAAAESFNTLLQERGSEPENLPNTKTRHKGCDSLDRATAAIRNDSTQR